MRRWWRKKKNEAAAKEREQLLLENGSKFLEKFILEFNGTSNSIRFFSYDQIIKATDGFDGKHCITFQWYKCVIEDRPYAIKAATAFQNPLEGYNDVVFSSRVSNHNSFLKLVGCCLEFPIPVMVFECPEYGLLNKRGCLGRDGDDGPLLPWNVRLKIAKEVAIAVTYLHTAFPRIIIHRDIKATNVVLDKNWTAKLTDFSISITLPEGKT